MVAYTSRYSSGYLIPNSATATLAVAELGILGLFIYMIPITCKITNFSFYLFVYFFENIILVD